MSDLHRILNHFFLSHAMMWQQLETLDVEYRAGTITPERFAIRVSEIVGEHEKVATEQKDKIEAAKAA